MNQIAVIIAKYFIVLSLVVALWVVSKMPRKLWSKVVVCFILAAAIGFILTKLAGVIYFDPRPFVIHNFTPLISHEADNGFPSDHTAFTMIIALIIYQFNRRAGFWLMIISLLIGFSRMYAGLHSSVDILGSIIIAIVTILITNYLSPKIKLGSLK